MAQLSDWATVVPAREDVREVAAALLALARTPQDVRTTGTGGTFLIPPYLADLYNAPAPKPRKRTVKAEEPPRSNQEGDNPWQ